MGHSPAVSLFELKHGWHRQVSIILHDTCVAIKVRYLPPFRHPPSCISLSGPVPSCLSLYRIATNLRPNGYRAHERYCDIGRVCGGVGWVSRSSRLGGLCLRRAYLRTLHADGHVESREVGSESLSWWLSTVGGCRLVVRVGKCRLVVTVSLGR